MKSIDFYSGFEGEPEITIAQFDVEGKTVFILRTWIGFFDAVLRKIKPQNGEWAGIVKHYHLETAWNEETWKCDDLTLLFIQLSKIDTVDFDEKEKKFYHAFISCVEHAVQSNLQLSFLTIDSEKRYGIK